MNFFNVPIVGRKNPILPLMDMNVLCTQDKSENIVLQVVLRVIEIAEKWEGRIIAPDQRQYSITRGTEVSFAIIFPTNKKLISFEEEIKKIRH